MVEFVKGGANSVLQNKVCIVMNTGYPKYSAIVIVVPMSHHILSLHTPDVVKVFRMVGWPVLPPTCLLKVQYVEAVATDPQKWISSSTILHLWIRQFQKASIPSLVERFVKMLVSGNNFIRVRKSKSPSEKCCDAFCFAVKRTHES